VSHTLDFVLRHGYVLLFFWILAEQAALPLPSAPLLVACGALAKDGRISPHLVILSGWAACMLADNFWFLLGRRGTRVLRWICKLALEPDSCVRRTETVFLRYGSRSLLVAKFVPGLNAVSAPMAALSGVSFARFILFDSLGVLLWIVSFGGLGYVFRHQLDRVGDYAAGLGAWVAVLAVALLGGWIGWKYSQRRRFLKKLAVSRITAQELRNKLGSGEEIVVVDVRSALESDTDSVPGALRIPLEELEARQGEIPRNRDIILFCS